MRCSRRERAKKNPALESRSRVLRSSPLLTAPQRAVSRNPGLELRVGRTANSAAPATPKTNAASLSAALRRPHVKNRKSRASFPKHRPRLQEFAEAAETGGEGEA